MNKLSLSLLAITFIHSCSLDKAAFSTIDGLPLGLKADSLIAEMSARKIHSTFFYDNLFYSEGESNKDNFLCCYESNFLNFKYGSSEHGGVIVPEVDNSTISGYVVALFHKDDATSVVNNAFVNLSELRNRKALLQYVNNQYIKKINSLLIARYGNPTSIDSNESTLYVFKNKTLISYRKPAVISKVIARVWRTKYYDVKFCEGINSEQCIFDNYSNTYSYILSEKYSLRKNQSSTHDYAYLYYSLNIEGRKIFKLDGEKEIKL
jgi:hypothetical protein